jgi:hypothetical protein
MILSLAFILLVPATLAGNSSDKHGNLEKPTLVPATFVGNSSDKHDNLDRPKLVQAT